MTRPTVVKVTRDGVAIYKVICPVCGTSGQIDDDQLHGRVSLLCAVDGCAYHETHDLSGDVPPPTYCGVCLREVSPDPSVYCTCPTARASIHQARRPIS